MEALILKILLGVVEGAKALYVVATVYLYFKLRILIKEKANVVDVNKEISNQMVKLKEDIIDRVNDKIKIVTTKLECTNTKLECTIEKIDNLKVDFRTGFASLSKDVIDLIKSA